jgi:hypothetical protein
MFAENHKLKALDFAKIKGLSEFGLNLDECQYLFSKDLRYGIIFTEVSIVIIDLNKRALISKFSSEKNSRISKLKITHRNTLTYLSRGPEGTKLIISSIDFVGNFFEWTVASDVQDYVYAESMDENLDYIFILYTKGDLEFRSLDPYNSFSVIKKLNISRDTAGKIKSFEVNYMDFVEETSNLLIFLSNGIIIYYTVSDDPESDKDSKLKTIAFEEILHVEMNQFDHLMKYTNSYDITTFKVTKFIYNYVDLKENNIGHKLHKDFLIIGFTKDKRDSIISFCEILGNRINILNRVKFDNRVILDSTVFQSKNDNLNNVLPDYFIICLKVLGGNNVEIFSYDFVQCFKPQISRLNEMEEEFNLSQNHSKIQDGLKTFIPVNKLVDDNSVRKLGIAGVYVSRNPDFYYKNLTSSFSNQELLGQIQDDRSIAGQSKIDDYKNVDYSINLIIRKLFNIHNFDVFVKDYDVQQTPYEPSKKFKQQMDDENFDFILFNNAITSDVSKYIKFLDIRTDNSNEILYRFRQRVIKTIQDEPIYERFSNLTGLNEDDTKIDFYLLLLLFNNELISIKYYLSLKDNIANSSKQFIVSNEKLFNTVYYLFFVYIKNLILDNLKSSSYDVEFFTNEKLLTNLENIKELLKISKNRVQNPYDRPFNRETELIFEDYKKIQAVLFEVENVILIIKIIRSYANNILENEKQNIVKIFEVLRDNVKCRKVRRNKKTQNERNKFTYLELVMMKNSEDIYPYWKNLFFSIINKFDLEDFIKLNLDGLEYGYGQNQLKDSEIIRDLQYFTKFQLFFYYLYFVLDYNNFCKNKDKDLSSFNNKSFPSEFSKNDHKIIFKSYFNEMEEEFKEYFKFAENFYFLDLNLFFNGDEISVIKKDHQIFPIDITKISNFLVRFNKSNITRTPYYKNQMNLIKINFNSLFTSILYNDGYSQDASILSKNIISLLNEQEDFMTQLNLLLEMGLINLAYQFVNNCFASLVFYSEDLENDSNPRNQNLLETIVKSEEFQNMKALYFHFYDFLIRNFHVALLFTLPYNFIERYLLKEFLLTHKEFEDLILLYFIKLRKIKEAENVYHDLEKSSYHTKESLYLYNNLLRTTKYLFEDISEKKTEENIINESGYLSVNVNLMQEKGFYEQLKKSSDFGSRGFNIIASNVLLGKKNYFYLF